MQYWQPVQGIVGYESSRSARSSRNAFSSSVRGLNPQNVCRLSLSTSEFVMPLRQHSTPGNEPTKRNAQLATELAGSRSSSFSVAASGSFARLPPSSGSIITTGIPFFSSSP